MLIAYLPKEKLVFQGDLLSLQASGKYYPSTVNHTTVHFYNSLQRLGLDVDKIALVHGPLTTIKELRNAIENRKAIQP